jgi:hypothetical protein
MGIRLIQSLPPADERAGKTMTSRGVVQGLSAGVLIGILWTGIAPLAGITGAAFLHVINLLIDRLSNFALLILDVLFAAGTALVVLIAGQTLHLWRRFRGLKPGTQGKKGAWIGLLIWDIALALTLFVLVA